METTTINPSIAVLQLQSRRTFLEGMFNATKVFRVWAARGNPEGLPEVLGKRPTTSCKSRARASTEIERLPADNQSERDVHLGFTFNRQEHDVRPYMGVIVYGVRLVGLLDSGSSRTIVGREGWRKLQELGIKLGQGTTRRVTLANGAGVGVLGTVCLLFEVQGEVLMLDCLVITSLPQTLILGADFITRAGVVLNLSSGEWNFSKQPTATVSAIRERAELGEDQERQLTILVEGAFRDMPNGIGCTHLVEHRIRTSAEPIKQRYYPVSPAVQRHIDSELEDMLKEGVIEKSNSPWASPIVMIKKKDGSFRFCVDYRKLNKVTERDAYPLPYISSTLDKLRDAKFLSSLDIKSAYWHIPVEENSRKYTAFTVPNRGLFQFKRMPFGLHNAPATWQRFIDTVIGADLEPHVFVYLDDIIVVTNNFEKHLEILGEVFNRLKGAGLKLSRDKCNFCMSSLRYLG